jgi:hypothetical protein
MQTMRLVDRYIRMFGCDTARILTVAGTRFLLIGKKRNTAQDSQSKWFRNGDPFDFDYIEEKVIASGKTLRDLLASAKKYKRLCGMTTLEYLRESASTTESEK